MTLNKSKTVAVGMSGGVDSTIAAALLLEQGNKVVGLTMKIWDGPPAKEDSGCHACYGSDEVFDIEDAKKTADQLGIKLHIIDLAKEYKKVVLDYFKREYLSGKTPNPCVVCNPKMKFGLLVEVARKTGIEFDYFATGHYARVEYNKQNDRYLLKKASHVEKDQSYFIYSLTQKQLSQTIFPLGDLTKEDVRNKAKSMNLHIAERPESQDFISDGDYSILFDDKNIKPGPIVDVSGNILGQHKGIINYTIGQRKGLGISAPNPLHVLRIDVKNNALIVGEKSNLYSKSLIANKLNWIAFDRLDSEIKVSAKIRQKHKESIATINPKTSNSVNVKFDEEQLSITPGQAIVFYDGDTVVGGGTIDERL